MSAYSEKDNLSAIRYELDCCCEGFNVLHVCPVFEFKCHFYSVLCPLETSVTICMCLLFPYRCTYANVNIPYYYRSDEVIRVEFRLVLVFAGICGVTLLIYYGRIITFLDLGHL